MGKCFVIQPFDKGKFDKRYEDVFKPAIIESGLEPYRVDQDPEVSIPIEDIENGISSADTCLVDITLDNPNIWFELGMAISSGKDIVLICAEERTTKYPFDVQHRRIIQYATGAPSDFVDLKRKITERLQGIISKQMKLSSLPQNVLTETKGLNQHEVASLISIAQNIDNPEDYVSVYTIRKDMENSGFTKIATTIALNKLLSEGFINYQANVDNNGDPYSVYGITATGMKWLMDNQDKLVLQSHKKNEKAKAEDFTDDIPF